MWPTKWYTEFQCYLITDAIRNLLNSSLPIASIIWTIVADQTYWSFLHAVHFQTEALVEMSCPNEAATGAVKL